MPSSPTHDSRRFSRADGRSAPPDGPGPPAPPTPSLFRAARASGDEGLLRAVGALVLILAGVPVVVVFALVAGEGQRVEPRCTVASCDAGADADQATPRAAPPSSTN